MTYEEITPHLNKIVRLNLKNNKRKLGWLHVDFYHEISKEPLKEVYCVNVLKGRKIFQKDATIDMKSVELHSEIIQIEDIFRIHCPR
jgi:hypothetical protein